MNNPVIKPKYIGDQIRFSYIRKYLPKTDYGKLLDAGSGQCEFQSLVQSKGYEYHAFDIHPVSPAIKGDICDIPFKDDDFDAVICVDVLEHVEDHVKAVNELRRVLKDDGLLLLHVPNKNQHHVLINQPEEQDDHVRIGYSPAELHTLFYDFNKISYYPTFNEMESIAWDIVYAVTHNIPINPSDMIDEEKWKSWINYGWAVVARK